MVFGGSNFGNWAGGGTRKREIAQMRSDWAEVEERFRRSLIGVNSLDDAALEIMRLVMRASDQTPAVPILVACHTIIEETLRTDDLIPLEADWPVIESKVEVAVEIRKLLTRRRRWANDAARMFKIASECFVDGFTWLYRQLPESCFERWRSDEGDALGVPLIELLDDPAEVVERFCLMLYTNDTLALEMFAPMRTQLITNMLIASGFPPDTNAHEVKDRLIIPTLLKGKTRQQLAELYLQGTPFLELAQLPVPFRIPSQVRFEHCHIIGGTGHGKTQLMQKLIHDDIVAAQSDGRSVVVIDSQGDLINKLLRLEAFDPYADRSLADRLVLIDPSDIEFPAALNLFDAHLERVQSYSAVDQERVLNGVVELYETFFGAMLGAELTQKQGVIFRYLARLMITIPGATIHTLMQVMEDGASFKPHMERLTGSARHFFATEFFTPAFAATKKQILRRLWGVLSTPAFERMFIQKENKLDLYAAMNEGKIILVSTAKDLLKQDGSALLGRFFVAMIAQAALERSVIDEDERTPTFVYIDEAQEYFDDNIETILNQARKYRVGLTLAHQTLDQLTPRLRSALHANTSLKFAGGVSAKDARALAEELHTTSDFIEGMRRRRDRTEFAAWVKNRTPSAIRLTAPLGYLERQPTSTMEAFETLMERNRARYCGTRALLELPAPTPIVAPVTPPPIARDAAPIVEQPPAPVAQEAPPPSTPVVEAPVAEPQLPRAAPPSKPLPPLDERELGKGGRQHRYLQALVRELGQQQGFRATVEAPIAGGQIDVALERRDIRAAFEITVTTPSSQEEANIRKCLDAGFQHVALVMVKSQAVGVRFQDAVLARLTPEQAARVAFLTAEELPDYILGLAEPPAPSESIVKGYRVKVRRAATTPQEAKVRRDAITKVVARSIVKNQE